MNWKGVVLLIGFIGCLYSQPDYMSKPSYVVPDYFKVLHIENKVDNNNVLWCHIKFTGFFCIEGWVPVAQMENKCLPGRK
jgi:hypothetical protein